jgi:hypothetical protein
MEFYSIQKIGSSYQVNSYESERWNALAAILFPAKDEDYECEEILSNIDRKQIDVILREMIKNGKLDFLDFKNTYDMIYANDQT